MLNSRTLSLALVVVMLLGSVVACSFSAERNEDGSWNITGTVNENDIAEWLAEAVANRMNLHSATVDLKDGYVLAEGQVTDLMQTNTYDITLRVDAMIHDGYLLIQVSNVMIDGQPADADLVVDWNQQLAEGAARRAEQHPDRTVLSVTITEDDITMTWRAETRRSRNGS